MWIELVEDNARKVRRLILAVTLILGITLILAPEKTQAQWPPFRFRLTPSYEQGKITYQVTFSSQVDWSMTNLAFKIPLPKGTRYVEAKAQPTTTVNFDGTEITFFTSVLYQPIRDASFVVEVTDPSLTLFTTHAWIAWEGDHPGNYLTEEFELDITHQPLNWEAPADSRLQLNMGAQVTDQTIVYTIYLKNQNRTSGVQMNDIQINIPVPSGTTFVSAEAPPPFVANFNGQEVSFFALTLEEGAEITPLHVRVSIEAKNVPFVTTYAWATWENAGKRVGVSLASREDTRTGDLIVQPGASQWVMADMNGDVPFSNYDLTSIALEDKTVALAVNFYTTGDLSPVGESLEFLLNIDSDCRTDTGRLWNNYLGLEYRVRYRHAYGDAYFEFWDEAAQQWNEVGGLEVKYPIGTKAITVQLPYALLKGSSQFCWAGEVRNRTNVYLDLPYDYLPNNEDVRLTQYQVTATAVLTPPETVAPPQVISELSGDFIKVGDIWQYLPGWTAPHANWPAINFDDSKWFSGPTKIGYGSGEYATDLSRITEPTQADGTPILVQRTITETGVTLIVIPSGETTSVFLRRAFNVTDPAQLTQLTLKVEYEGGFIAYLNGREVARRNLGNPNWPASFDTLAVTYQPDNPEVIDLSNYIPQLVNGTNVLAFQVHRSLNSPNLLINPQLTGVNNPPVAAPVSSNSGITSTISATLPVAASPVDIKGKLAVPLDNGQAIYNVHVFSLPDGQEIAQIPYARQPNFRFDGQRLLINHEGGGAENLYEYNLGDYTETQVSDAPKDSHPFYDLWGNRVVYGNSELTYGKPEQVYDEKENKWYYTGVHKPFIFVQCGLLPPHQENEPRCRNIPFFGVLVPAGQTSEIQGTNPVWTSNDMIAYKGCNSWAGFGACGIYIVPSSSTKGFSDGFIPRQLTKDTGDTPSDTKGDWIAFSSYRDGNWEAYVMDLDGANVRNLSNSATSNDGLSTLSPDGNWVAFVSDRGSRWAIWVVPITGGSAKKLFDLPDIPWGDGDRAWTNERISWGP